MERPEFTREQMEYLNFILTPYCCHVSGEHNPTHFDKDPEAACYLQKYKAWEKAVKTLGINPKPMSAPGCFWCGHDHGNGESPVIPYTPLFEEEER